MTDDVRNQAPKAATMFKDCGLNTFLLKNVEKSGYTVPTPIQQNAIPIINAQVRLTSLLSNWFLNLNYL